MDSFFAEDIRKLNTLYNRTQFSFVFLYGRYGTGKTSLIREFCRNRPTVFYSAQEALPAIQLYDFHREVKRLLNLPKMPPVFSDWANAFSFIADCSFSRRLVFVLDEFQNLVKHCPEFMTDLDRAVRHTFPAGKVFLILSSSAVGYASELMQEPVSSPFHAVTARAFLGPQPFSACQPMLSGYSPKDRLLLYGVTGGLPSLLRLLQPEHSAQQNLTDLFFRPDSPLLMGPSDALSRELREPAMYKFLLEIIAFGCTKLTDIAARASIGTNKCAKYLNVLISLGLIQKELPSVGEPMRKVRYVFADHMLRFWYRFVCPNISDILFGRGESLLNSQILPVLDGYLLPVFENVCAEYLEWLAGSGQTPFPYRHAGAWWTGGTRREPFFRIPLVATDTEHAVLGTCHCSQEPADVPLLEQLTQPLEPFDGLTRYCCIFSLSGFTQELKDAAHRTGNVWLIDLDDICGL